MIEESARGSLVIRAYNEAKRLGIPESAIGELVEAWLNRRTDLESARPTERRLLHADFVSWAASRKGLPDGAAEKLRQMGTAPLYVLLAAEHELRRSNGKLYYGRIGLKPVVPVHVALPVIDGLALAIASQRAVVSGLDRALTEARSVLAALEASDRSSP